MDFRDKKPKTRKSKYEEQENKQKRRKSLHDEKNTKNDKKGRKSKKGDTELTKSLLTLDDRQRDGPRSFFDQYGKKDDAYNYRSETESVVSSVQGKDDEVSEPLVNEDYKWDFVVVLPTDIPEIVEDDEEQQLPALEPTEVRHY